MLKRNGVAPDVAAYSNGGASLPADFIIGDGFDLSPAQTAVIGIMSARFKVCSITRRTLRYPSPGRLPRQASTALMVSSRHPKPRFCMVFTTSAALSSHRPSSSSKTRTQVL